MLALGALTGNPVEADKAPSEIAVVVAGQQIGQSSDRVVNRLETLARRQGHVALLKHLAARAERYSDYRCTFTKQERIDGTLHDEQTIDVTFRNKPFSVGMKWVKNAPRGDRVLFIEGRYGGKMLVRPSGYLARKFVPTALRKPDGPDAMKSTLRPVSRFGFRRSIQSLIDVYELAASRGELREEVAGYAELDGRKTLVLHRYLPERPDYPAALTKIYIDVDYQVPVMVEGYGWADEEFICRYRFSDLKFNLGLADKDFDLANFDLVDPR